MFAIACSSQPLRLPHWLHLPRRLAHCTRGAFAVEFALVAPLLLLLLLGAIDVSLVIQEKLTLQSAVRSGIQYGLLRRPVQGDMQQLIQAVKSTLPDSWTAASDNPSYTIDAHLQCMCNESGAIDCETSCPTGEYRMSYLHVDMTKTHSYLFHYPQLGSSIDLTENAFVRLQ